MPKTYQDVLLICQLSGLSSDLAIQPAILLPPHTFEKLQNVFRNTIKAFSENTELRVNLFRILIDISWSPRVYATRVYNAK